MGVDPVNRGVRGDARSVAALMAEAFELDPVSRWLLPEPEERRRRHMRFFLVFVEHVLQQQDVRQGELRLAFDGEGYVGAALWLSVGTAERGLDPDMERVEEALGPDAFERFMALNGQMRRHHPPDVRHAYLPFVAVLPQRQGQGIGRRLLATTLADLDETGTPAYLEASNERSRHLYQRLGFKPLGDAFPLPGGPQVYPLWREPARQRWPENSRWASWPS